MKTLLTVLFTSGVVFAAHAADYNTSSMFNTPSSEEATTPSEEINDTKIAQQVRDILAGGWFTKGFETVTFKVTDGNVQLTGSVPTEDDKAKIETAIKNIDGVQALDSQVIVKDTGNLTPGKMSTFSQDRFVTPSDKQLNLKIHDAITQGNLAISFKNVKLNTNNGVVRLEGTVASPHDQEILIQSISKIPGVKSVSSSLDISK